jgi:hypothetical protein
MVTLWVRDQQMYFQRTQSAHSRKKIVKEITNNPKFRKNSKRKGRTEKEGTVGSCGLV